MVIQLFFAGSADTESDRSVTKETDESIPLTEGPDGQAVRAGLEIHVVVTW